MFSNITDKTRVELDTVRQVLETHEAIRDLVYVIDPFAAEPTTEAHLRWTSDPLRQIKDIAPQRNDWLIYDHCAALTRMYAIFEKFIEDLVTEYLRLLPALYPAYVNLPDRIVTQHRLGVAQILQKLGKEGPYKDLSESDVVRGLALGQSGGKYTLLPDAFLIDPQNYRAETVNKIFQYLGFDNLWAGLEKHPRIEHFMKTRDATETPRTMLKKLVDDRNSASHSGALLIWSLSELMAFAEFLRIITEVLAGLVMKSAISRGLHIGELFKIGTVIHRFRDNVVGVELTGGEIAVGDRISIIEKYGAVIGQVISLAIMNEPFESIVYSPGLEIGVKFDLRIAEGAQLLKPVEQLSLPTTEGSPEPITPDDYPLDSDDKESEGIALIGNQPDDSILPPV
jgi:hypothetical protein